MKRREDTCDVTIRIAVTGGPGAGKTLLLKALAARGFAVVPEVARTIIAERLARGLSPRPAQDQFARQIMDGDIRQYGAEPPGSGPIFYDRSLLDSLGMLAQSGQLQDADRNALLTRYPYHPVGFILPPWREIYRTDSERDQTFDESVAVYRSLREWYGLCGYQLIEVPEGNIDERCEFVLQTLKTILS